VERASDAKRASGLATPRPISGLSNLQVQLGADFATSIHFALGPAGETGHDRQSTPRGAFGTERAGMGHSAGMAGIANAQRESVRDELKLHFDPVALSAPVTDRVRNELARHEQGVLHVPPVDPASTKCAS
jgi:hypothetical protein